MSKRCAMRRVRVLVAALVAGSVLAGVGALVTPASARPDGFGTCHVNLISSDGDGNLTIGGSGKPIECYY